MSSFREVDGDVANWIKGQLTSGIGPRVVEQVPDCYESFARIFHPPHDRFGHRDSWSRIALSSGKTVHAEMQWKAISVAESEEAPNSRWDGSRPGVTGPDRFTWKALSRILAARDYKQNQVCYYGMSTIHTDVGSEFADAKQFVFGSYSFVFIEVPLHRLESCAESSEYVPFPPPNILWPMDKSWFLAADYDFDSTLVGGTSSLIQTVIDDPALEALEISPDASLAADADYLNDLGKI